MVGQILIKILKFIAQVILFLLQLVLAGVKLFLLLFGLVAKIVLALVRIATP